MIIGNDHNDYNTYLANYRLLAYNLSGLRTWRALKAEEGLVAAYRVHLERTLERVS